VSSSLSASESPISAAALSTAPSGESGTTSVSGCAATAWELAGCVICSITGSTVCSSKSLREGPEEEAAAVTEGPCAGDSKVKVVAGSGESTGRRSVRNRGESGKVPGVEAPASRAVGVSSGG